MDFGEILNSEDAWKNFEDKDHCKAGEKKIFKEIKRVKTDAVIDLHGMTIKEAEEALNFFFDHAYRSGFKKVIIIHGKGNHSRNGPVLKDWVKKYLSLCRKAGRTGTPGRNQGGTGATWVMIKK